MRSTISALALGAAMVFASQAAFAFTYENQGTTQPTTAPQAQAKAGYVDTDPGSLIPPIGHTEPGVGYDFGPGAFNNGLAQQPTRSESVGPSWLYPPR